MSFSKILIVKGVSCKNVLRDRKFFHVIVESRGYETVNHHFNQLPVNIKTRMQFRPVPTIKVATSSQNFLERSYSIVLIVVRVRDSREMVEPESTKKVHRFCCP